MERRDFLRNLAKGTAAVAAVGFLSHREVTTLTGPLSVTADWPLLQTSKGQTVEDIIIGFAATPQDVSHHITFYRSNHPSYPALSLPLNQRASFRWVCAPGHEIKLDPGERLLWTHTAYGHTGEPAKPNIWMQGIDRETGEIIVNQSVYAYPRGRA